MSTTATTGSLAHIELHYPAFGGDLITTARHIQSVHCMRTENMDDPEPAFLEIRAESYDSFVIAGRSYSYFRRLIMGLLTHEFGVSRIPPTTTASLSDYFMEVEKMFNDHQPTGWDTALAFQIARNEKGRYWGFWAEDEEWTLRKRISFDDMDE